MNPFTHSTVALPLSRAPSCAANDPGKPQAEAAPKAERPSSPPARSGRSQARTPRSVRLARRSRSEARLRISAGWATHCKKFSKGLLAAVLALSWPAAWAVNVNSATAEQLETVNGIGPKTAQVIIDERSRGGSFESFEDLTERVKGIGPKKAQSLQAAGLTVEQSQSASKPAAQPAQRKPAR